MVIIGIGRRTGMNRLLGGEYRYTLTHRGAIFGLMVLAIGLITFS